MSKSILKTSFILLSLVFFTTNTFSQKTAVKKAPTPTHLEVFNNRMQLDKPKSMAEGVLMFGQTFKGNAYPKSHIDTTKRASGKVKLQPIGQEVLVVNLRQFDCVTFVESMIALTQTRMAEKPSFALFKQNLTKVRYRKGEIHYAARLHYYSDWLFENEKRGILKNITKELGGEPFIKPVYYMSYKKDTLYGNMAEPATFKRMKKVEEEITAREKFYIPKERVYDIESKIKDGDIIAITNRLDGMDMAHTGFAIWQNGRLYMLHASSQFHQVLITDVPLVDYLARNKSQTGIMVGRLN